MANLPQPQNNDFDVGALAPSGPALAVCLDVQDQFQVERRKFENPQETEKLDVTRFLLGFKGQDGQLYKIQSFEMRISGSPKSNLFKFLTSWLGKHPGYGWDYCDLKGQGAQITVDHRHSRDGTRTYANIVGIAPVIDQLKAQVLPLEAFNDPEGPGQSGTPVVNPTPAPTPPTQTQPSEATPNQPWNPAVDSQDDCPF